MKVRNFGIFALLLFLGSRGQASNSQTRNNSSAGQISEAETLRAVTALIDAKIIVLDQDPDKMILRQDVTDKLRATGKFEEAYSATGVFCY